MELSANDVLLIQRRNRSQHLDLFVAQRFAVGSRWRLHRQVREHLEQMILNHVADRAGLVVERAATLYAEILAIMICTACR